MQIAVKLFASLRIGRFVEKVLDLPPGVIVGEVIRELDLPENEVTLIFINGRHAGLTTPLAEGDVLAFFPPVGGG